MEFSSYQKNTNGEGNMTSYYLLRKNQESGPYTRKELKSLPLYTTDLLWVNGESTCWRSPDEIDDLKNLAVEPEKSTPVRRESNHASSQENQPINTQVGNLRWASHEDYHSPIDCVINSKPSFDELQRKHCGGKSRKKVWEKPLYIGANLLGITTLILGLGASAYMIKKAVDNIDHEPVSATADAHAIEEQVMAASTTSHAAMSTSAMVPSGPDSPSLKRPVVQAPANAIEKKISIPIAPSEMSDSDGAITDGLALVDIATENKQVTEPPVQADFAASKTAEEKDEPAPAEDKTATSPSLQLNANDYKVGFLGGISDLQLSVSNPSGKAVTRAVVEIEYLKANGQVLSLQTVEVSGIGPGASKKIAVPDHSRGVSIRYRVVSVES